MQSQLRVMQLCRVISLPNIGLNCVFLAPTGLGLSVVEEEALAEVSLNLSATKILRNWLLG